jgi:hypothetical protein
MITMTFADFYKTDWDEGEHELYVLKRGSDVLYVGISERGIWNRWFGSWGHIPANGWGERFAGSQAGRAVLQNAPESANWIMELWTVQDCARFINRPDLRFRNIRQVEPYMIELLKPSLNVALTTYAKKPSELIDHAELEAAYREVFG